MRVEDKKDGAAFDARLLDFISIATYACLCDTVWRGMPSRMTESDWTIRARIKIAKVSKRPRDDWRIEFHNAEWEQRQV